MLHLFAPLFICLQELDKTCSTSLHQPSSGQLDEPVWVNICTAVGVVFVFRAALDKLLSGTVWEWTEKKVLGGCIYEGRECGALPASFPSSRRLDRKLTLSACSPDRPPSFRLRRRFFHHPCVLGGVLSHAVAFGACFRIQLLLCPRSDRPPLSNGSHRV